MPLKYEVKDVSELNESIRPLYQEFVSGSEKVYRLDIDGVKPMSEFENVYKALQSERGFRENAEKKLKSYGEYTPEAIQALTEELNGYKATASNNPAEEYMKNIEEIKRSQQQILQDKSTEWARAKEQYEKDIKLRDDMIMGMKLDTELQTIYSEKGDARMFAPFTQIAQQDLEWNEDRKEFRTKDGLYNSKEWLENVCYRKYPGFLKGNISASAAETSYKDIGNAKYFDPKSPYYNKTEQAKIFKQNPEQARELLSRFKGK